ncbi:MAG: 4Fe-4S dicluster domain-containing protein [Candidatus Scatosoma sp.]
MTREERLENLLELSGTNVYACMKCGKCSGRCPADVQPHRFVSLLARGRLEELLNSEKAWDCLTCYACAERCPRGVSPVFVVEAVRKAQVCQKESNKISAEEIPPAGGEHTPQQLLVSVFRKYNG